MSLLLLGIALAAQPTFNNGPPPSMPPPHERAIQDWRDSPTPRRALHAFGACLAERNAVVVRAALMIGHASRNYNRRVGRLVEQQGSDCFRMRGGRMSFDHAGLGGAMAEHLIEREPQPLNVRLARAALGPAGAAHTPADRVATCVVRSVPDQVSALLATDVDGPAEEEAAAALMPAFSACSGQSVRLSLTISGVRTVLATAAYRSLFVQTAGR